MSRKRNRTTMSTTQVQMPDGTVTEAQVTHYPEGTKMGPPGETYPETDQVTMSEDEHKAKEAAEAEEREKRASRAKGPRKLKPDEQKVVKYFLDTYIAQDEPMTKTVGFDQLHIDMKPYFQPSMKDNLIARGIFNAVYDEESRQLTGVQLTEGGAELYLRMTRKPSSNGEQPTTGRKRGAGRAATTTAVSRATKYPDNLRLRKLAVGNPRQTDSHGYHAYNLYEDGMTYNQYLKKAFDSTLKSGSSGAPFSGPKRVHWDWDINHGHIGLYYVDQQEFNEDGSPNLKFWYANMSSPKPATTEETKTEETVE